MAKIDSTGAGESGKPRPQVQSFFPAREPAATAALGGDTVARSSSGPRDLPPQFGPYRVKQKLGGGGMGTVYLVENTALEREEALKIPHFGNGDDPQLRERFLREARSAAKLDHANLCPIYAAGVQDGIYYLTMRFLRGKLLSDYTGKPQPARKSVEIVTKLAQALEAAHAEGVIHRDLKPSNVIMVAGVGPVVMDFGLAKQVRQLDQKLTQMGTMLGTPAYMPPEQVNGDLDRMGPPSDVYSLGVILYELLTGRLPFEGSAAAVFGQILSTEPLLPSTLVRGLNPALDGICRKAMAKVTTERYPSMKAFAAALMDYLRSTPATDGAGNLVSPGVHKAAILQAPTAVPGLLAAVKADTFQAATLAPGPQAAATVPPQVRNPVPPTQTAGKAPSARRKPDGARQPAQTKSTFALKWFALAAVAGSAVLCLGLSTVLLVWLASRAGRDPADNDASANGKTNKEQVGANDKANSEAPDSKPAEPEPVEEQEVNYDMDQFAKDFGLKLKANKRQPGKTEGDTLITMTLEFTKDMPSAIKGGFPPIGGIPYKSLEGLRTVLDGGMIRERLQGPGKDKGGMVGEGLQLRCYFFDDEGVAFTKQAPGKIDGAVSGVKGDSFRISQSVPNAVLAKTKKISYRAEPIKTDPFKK